VVQVHALCLAGPVIDAPGLFFSWDLGRDGEGWFWFECGHDCYECALGLAVLSVFAVSEELDAGVGCGSVGCNLSA